jgi:hypothetical protein
MIPLPVRLRYPREVPALLTAIAGAVLLLESLFFATLGGYAGYLGALAGIVLLGLAAGLHHPRRGGRALGVGVVLVSVVAFFLDFGFYPATLLGILGGSLAIASGGAPYAVWRARSTPKFDLGPVCPRCGHHIPTWSPTCPYCG